MKILIKNKRAHLEYRIEKSLVAGMVLVGAEVKSLRLGHGSLQGSFVKILSGEAFLINATVTAYQNAPVDSFETKRTRKLLLSRKELDKLMGDLTAKGKTLVPLAIVLDHNRIKLEVGLGTGKKLYEKREDKKKKDQKRQLQAAYKTHGSFLE